MRRQIQLCIALGITSLVWAAIALGPDVSVPQSQPVTTQPANSTVRVRTVWLVNCRWLGSLLPNIVRNRELWDARHSQDELAVSAYFSLVKEPSRFAEYAEEQAGMLSLLNAFQIRWFPSVCLAKNEDWPGFTYATLHDAEFWRRAAANLTTLREYADQVYIDTEPFPLKERTRTCPSCGQNLALAMYPDPGWDALTIRAAMEPFYQALAKFRRAYLTPGYGYWPADARLRDIVTYCDQYGYYYDAGAWNAIRAADAAAATLGIRRIEGFRAYALSPTAPPAFVAAFNTHYAATADSTEIPTIHVFVNEQYMTWFKRTAFTPAFLRAEVNPQQPTTAEAVAR